MRSHQVNGQLDMEMVKAGSKFEIRPLSLNDFLLGEAGSSLGGRIPEVALD